MLYDQIGMVEFARNTDKTAEKKNTKKCEWKKNWAKKIYL